MLPEENISKFGSGTPQVALVVGHSRKYGGNEGGGFSEHAWWLPRCKQIGQKLWNEYGISSIVTHRNGNGVFRSLEFWDEYNDEKFTYRILDVPVIHFHLNGKDESLPDSQPRGHEVLYARGSAQGKALAERMNAAAGEALGNPDRGLKPLSPGDNASDLVFSPKVGVVVEPAFLDVAADRQNLFDKSRELENAYVKAIAQAIKDGE